MGRSLDVILSRLKKRKKQGDQWMACCPAHKDSTPSLSVYESEGRVLLHCFAGCTTESIVEAMNLDMTALFDDAVESAPVIQSDGCTLAALANMTGVPIDKLKEFGLHQDGKYVNVPYENESGRLLHNKIRTRLTGKNKYKYPKGSKATLYGLNRLSDARDKGAIVIVEGESDCWTLWIHGIPALGVPGASAYKLLDREHLDGIDTVFVVQESDEAGEKFQYAVGQHLRDFDYEGDIKIVTMGEYNDPNEMYVQNVDNFRRMFRAHCKKARPWTADFVDDMIKIMSEVEAGSVDFVWKPYIPIGGLTILAGQAGIGKSSLTYKLTALLSSGRCLPGEMTPSGEKRILLFSSEDHMEHVIKPRLILNEAKQENIGAFDFENYGLTFNKKGMETIEAIVARFKPDFMIFDPIVEFLGAKVDLFRANEIRPMLSPLRDLVNHYQIGCLLVAHIGKDRTGRKINDIVGSQDFGAIVRSGLGIEREEESDFGVMYHTKCNIAQKGLPVPFSIENGFFKFDGLVDSKKKDKFDEVAGGNVVEFPSPEVQSDQAPF